jgi:hypothetical protein
MNGKLVTVEIDRDKYHLLSECQKEMLRVYSESAIQKGTLMVFTMAHYRWDELKAEGPKQ